MYDSSVDTKQHIAIIQDVARTIVFPTLEARFENHDASKLNNFKEKSGYDKYVPMLQQVTYGSPGYFTIREEMTKNCFALHANANSHHPEHYPDGIDGMDLFDVLEMFCDWFSAAERSDTDFSTGMKMNQKRFQISPQLMNIFENTYSHYFVKYEGTFNEKIKEATNE